MTTNKNAGQVLTEERFVSLAQASGLGEFIGFDRVELGRELRAFANAVLAAAPPAQPDADVLYDVRELLGHIADLLPDAEFSKIDTKLWNNVSRHTAAPTTGRREPLEIDVECLTDESGTDYSVVVRGGGLRMTSRSDVWMKRKPAEKLAKWLAELLNGITGEQR